jgi:hypothetical protein
MCNCQQIWSCTGIDTTIQLLPIKLYREDLEEHKTSIAKSAFSTVSLQKPVRTLRKRDSVKEIALLASVVLIDRIETTQATMAKT